MSEWKLGVISLDDAIDIVDSYGPTGADVNEDFQIKMVLRDAIKDLRFELSSSQAREAELREKLEAAEARIKASQEQEPFKFCDTATGRVHDYAYDCEGNAKAVYLEPVIPPELAELQRKNAELTRKLAEQNKEHIDYIHEIHMFTSVLGLIGMPLPTAWKAQLRKLLESKVQEVYCVFHEEEFVGSFFQHPFSSEQLAKEWIVAQTNYPPDECSVFKYVVDTKAVQPKEPKQSPETDLDETLRRQ